MKIQWWSLGVCVLETGECYMAKGLAGTIQVITLRWESILTIQVGHTADNATSGAGHHTTGSGGRARGQEFRTLL